MEKDNLIHLPAGEDREREALEKIFCEELRAMDVPEHLRERVIERFKVAVWPLLKKPLGEISFVDGHVGPADLEVLKNKFHAVTSALISTIFYLIAVNEELQADDPEDDGGASPRPEKAV
jgi:hypothetical protein